MIPLCSFIVLICCLGMFFYSALNFLPTTWADVYPNDPIQIGLKGLPPAISTTIGAIFFSTYLRKPVMT